MKTIKFLTLFKWFLIFDVVKWDHQITVYFQKEGETMKKKTVFKTGRKKPKSEGYWESQIEKGLESSVIKTKKVTPFQEGYFLFAQKVWHEIEKKIHSLNATGIKEQNICFKCSFM